MIKLISPRTVEGYQSATWQECVDYFSNRPSVAFDTETDNTLLPFNGRLLSVQLGDSETQYVINARESMNVPALREVLTNRLVLAHNMKFDWKWMASIGIDVRKFYDTFIGEAILTTGFEDEERHLGLKACSEKYAGTTLHKEDRGKLALFGFTPLTIEYCAGDVRHLHTIMDSQKEQIRKFDLTEVESLEMRTTRVLAIMEYNGVLIDKNTWMEVAQETERNAARYENLLDECARTEPRLKSLFHAPQLDMFSDVVRDTDINWASPAQKQYILSLLGFNLKSVDSRDLLRIRKKHPIVQLMIDYSKQYKLASSFGRKFIKEHINPVTHLVHPDYFQIVSTGRISCSDPNLLNIPSHGPLAKKIRSAFIARPNHKIVGGDFSNFELRIIAEFAEDPLWDKVFAENGDLHTELCCKVFNIPVSKVKSPFPMKPEFTYRDVQKTIDFGLAYGMSKYKLSDLIGITPAKAQDIINTFFRVVPNVKRLLDELGKTGREQGRIRTAPPFGRIRWFPNQVEALETGNDKVLGGIDRAARNAPIQGTNGDVIKLALCNLQDQIDEHDYPMEIKLSVYDEIQTECPEEFAEQAKQLLEQTMVSSARVVIQRTPVKADVTINDCWTK